ncbi:arylesterase [Nitrosomonas sp. JL21]|uniref:arylesterase n=1 Tax=Nitrosomonas sp. JL21 TaxID=153949 RepID=UPI001F03E79E|nr:arylesterase [Nitrosomonas sp. JL21]
MTPAIFAAPKIILVFGDSLSAGYGIPAESSWVSLLTQRVQSKFAEYQIINASISGETTLGGRNRIKQALQQHRPDIIILELGANDGLRGASIKSIHDNLAHIIEICQQNNTLVLLVGMQLPPNYGITYTKKFQGIFSQLAENYQIKSIPFLLAGFGDKHEFFQADGIHPNEMAQHNIVENIWEVLLIMLNDAHVATRAEP